ncbi:hypothetical protein NDU88_004881 [Pleurodeles waltl]|uniref:Uncharacterized protein n=1 Tax=Pleurodeles waltl TaxID=8319 RepID=A0AAV7MHV1_PLEWA|nr:hypothetical protein NDU88_004881 [Pleurodeles waltl]
MGYVDYWYPENRPLSGIFMNWIQLLGSKSESVAVVFQLDHVKSPSQDGGRIIHRLRRALVRDPETQLSWGTSKVNYTDRDSLTRRESAEPDLSPPGHLCVAGEERSRASRCAILRPGVRVEQSRRKLQRRTPGCSGRRAYADEAQSGAEEALEKPSGCRPAVGLTLPRGAGDSSCGSDHCVSQVRKQQLRSGVLDVGPVQCPALGRRPPGPPGGSGGGHVDPSGDREAPHKVRRAAAGEQTCWGPVVGVAGAGRGNNGLRRRRGPERDDKNCPGHREDAPDTGPPRGPLVCRCDAAVETWRGC